MDWDKLYRQGSAYKVPLPAYPFDRVRCWIDIPETPAIQYGKSGAAANFSGGGRLLRRTKP